MNYRMLGYFLGVILFIESAFMLFLTVTALIYGESVMPFLMTFAILLAVSLPFVIFKPKNTKIYAKEGFICVGLSWILLSVFGSLPFVFSGSINSFVDAFFETVSGFSTTGATILSDVESLDKSILLWRSFTHWVGGMGVLVFMLALFPSGDGQTIYLMRAEVPGPVKGKLVPKMKQTALILYGIYFVLTVLQIVLLLFTGMDFYDSLVNSFATAGTGGFTVKNQSIMAYNNPAAEWIIAVFMLIFGINFNLFYLILLKRVREAIKSDELRAYLIICALATAIIAFNISDLYNSLEPCLRSAFFQTTTIMSTTGFSTADFNLWPVLSKTVLLVLMVFGACAGSTAGGLKISRVILLFKNFVREVKHMLRPRSVNLVRLDGDVVPEENVRAATNYLSAYFALIIVSILLISVDNFSVETNLSSVLACVNNVGPGFDATGPMSNYSCFSDFSKIVLSFDMLFGRLEIIPMLILFSPKAWKGR